MANAILIVVEIGITGDAEIWAHRAGCTRPEGGYPLAKRRYPTTVDMAIRAAEWATSRYGAGNFDPDISVRMPQGR